MPATGSPSTGTPSVTQIKMKKKKIDTKIQQMLATVLQKYTKIMKKTNKYNERLPQGPHQLECPVLSRCPQNLRPVFLPLPRINTNGNSCNDNEENGNNTNGNLEDACNENEENGGTKRDENTSEPTSESSSSKEKVYS